MMRWLESAVAVVAIALLIDVAHACDIRSVLSGPTIIKNIRHPDYETGIIFRDVRQGGVPHVLAHIHSPVADGSRTITQPEGQLCARLLPDWTLETRGSDCSSCDTKSIRLQKISDDAFEFFVGGKLEGVISGTLPR